MYIHRNTGKYKIIYSFALVLFCVSFCSHSELVGCVCLASFSGCVDRVAANTSCKQRRNFGVVSKPNPEDGYDNFVYNAEQNVRFKPLKLPWGSML